MRRTVRTSSAPETMGGRDVLVVAALLARTSAASQGSLLENLHRETRKTCTLCTSTLPESECVVVLAS